MLGGKTYENYYNCRKLFVMKNLKFVLFLSILVLNITLNFAQNKEDSSCACCTEAHEAFDFWVGDWTVFDANGKILGTNSIHKEYGNCVLKEQWNSSGNTRGTSYNYYNAKEKSWNQVWIDNSGFSLELKGTYDTNKMVLISTLLKGEKENYYHRITWQKNEDDSVTQTWDLLSEKQEKTREVFKGIYKKKVK